MRSAPSDHGACGNPLPVRRRAVATPASLLEALKEHPSGRPTLALRRDRGRHGSPASRWRRAHSPPRRAQTRNARRLSGKPGGWREVVRNRQQLDFGGDQISPAKRSIAARQPYTTSFLRRPARVCGFSTRPFLCPTATAESERRSRSSDCVTEAIDKRTRAMDEAERPPARTRMPTRVVVG
jgi:hypothetical protein